MGWFSTKKIKLDQSILQDTASKLDLMDLRIMEMCDKLDELLKKECTLMSECEDCSKKTNCKYICKN